MTIRTDKPFRMTPPSTAGAAPVTPQGTPALSQNQGQAPMSGPKTEMPPLQTPSIPYRNLK